MVERGGRVYFDEQFVEERVKRRITLSSWASDLEKSRAKGGEGPTMRERMEKLGFAGPCASVFDLLPLIQVAWADGIIQSKERSLILDVLETRGFRPGDEVFTHVESLLESRPSDAYMNESLELLRDLLGDRPAAGETVVNLCVRVAEAAGGFLGLGNKVSGEEREALARVAAVLGERAQAELKRSL